MIHIFPTAAIKELLKKEVPEKHAFWWVRGEVLSVTEIERATANPDKENPGGRLRNRVIQIGDLDRPSDGYDIEIEGVSFPIEPNDIVSLLGHEPTSAKRVSAPRLLINHNTGGLIKRAYPRATSLDWGVLPMVERKYWLSIKSPANPAEKLKNLWIILAVFLLPLVLVGFFLGGPIGAIGAPLIIALLLAPAMIFLGLLWKYLDWIEAQPRFSFEGDAPRLMTQNYRAFVNFNRKDLTPLYEKLARLVHSYALDNPAPDVRFVVVDRGAHTNGLMKNPTALPMAGTAPTKAAPKLVVPPSADATESDGVAV